jgi:hypothetical protein
VFGSRCPTFKEVIDDLDSVRAAVHEADFVARALSPLLATDRSPRLWRMTTECARTIAAEMERITPSAHDAHRG